MALLDGLKNNDMNWKFWILLVTVVFTYSNSSKGQDLGDSGSKEGTEPKSTLKVYFKDGSEMTPLNFRKRESYEVRFENTGKHDVILDYGMVNGSRMHFYHFKEHFDLSRKIEGLQIPGGKTIDIVIAFKPKGEYKNSQEGFTIYVTENKEKPGIKISFLVPVVKAKRKVFPLKIEWVFDSEALTIDGSSAKINKAINLPSTSYIERKIKLTNVFGKEVEFQLEMSDADTNFCRILDWQNPRKIGKNNTIEVPLQLYPYENAKRTLILNIHCEDQEIAFSIPLNVPEKARGKLEVKYNGEWHATFKDVIKVKFDSTSDVVTDTLWLRNSGLTGLSMDYLKEDGNPMNLMGKNDIFSFDKMIPDVEITPGAEVPVVLTFTSRKVEAKDDMTIGITDGHDKVKIRVVAFSKKASKETFNWWWLTLGILPVLVIVFRKKLWRLLTGNKSRRKGKPKKSGDSTKPVLHPMLEAFRQQDVNIQNVEIQECQAFVKSLKQHLQTIQDAGYDSLETLEQMTHVLQSQSRSSKMTSRKNRELEAFQQKLLDCGLRKDDLEQHPAWVKSLLELNVYHDNYGISMVSEWKEKAGVLEDIQPKADAFDRICSNLRVSNSSIQSASDKIVGWASQSAFGLPVTVDDFFDQIEQAVKLLEGMASKMPANHDFHKEVQIILSGPNGNRGLRYAQQVSKDREGLLVAQLKLNGLHELATVSASHFYAKFISQLLMDPLNRMARLYVFTHSGFSFFERSVGQGTSEFKAIKDSFEGLELSLVGMEIQIIHPQLGKDAFSEQKHTEGISSEWLQELREDVDRLPQGTIYDMLRIGIKAWEGKPEELSIKPQVMYKH